VKRYKIRLYGHGVHGTVKVSLKSEPTIKMVDYINHVAGVCVEKGYMKLEKDTFFADERVIITYEELFNEVKKEKELILGSWV
tara:strand:- start:924 stop:1172 length:249 start_codon:yes stop_codon:yes gene_type:complete